MNSPSPAPWRIAAAGALALATAMGIGRFAFTPILPMMLQGGLLDLAGASWLASANYVGYLVGALLCTLQPWQWRRPGSGIPFAATRPTRLVRAGLVATCLLTLAMSLHLPAAWPVLRFASGVASAFVFIYTSGWCAAQLARLGVPNMAALIFMGPGSGIVMSGVVASGLLAWHWPAWSGWAVFGVLALVLTMLVWPVFSSQDGVSAPTAPAARPGPAAHPHGRTEVGVLAFAYGLAGFGYIVTATFLPVIARQAMPGSPWLDLFWPVFGAGVVVGALAASRPIFSGDMRVLLAGCYLMQAAGIAASLAWPTLAGFAFGSLLLGLPFTVITFFALIEVRRIRPHSAAATMGLLTALYGIGQIAGPPMTAALLARSSTPAIGFDWALGIAAASLVVGALMYLYMARRWPTQAPPQGAAGVTR